MRKGETKDSSQKKILAIESKCVKFLNKQKSQGKK